MSTSDFEVTGYDTGLFAHTPDQTALRDRIADKLTADAYECDGKCGLSERECYDAHPITFSAMAGGTTHVNGSVTAIADAVLAVLYREWPWLRAETEDAASADQVAGARQSDDPDRIVAYRSRGGRLLRCLAHHPGREAIGSGDFRPVTADELPDGGICTYPTPAGSLSLRCGVDVLIPQPAAGARQDGAQQ
jgi:hypothetical protein